MEKLEIVEKRVILVKFSFDTDAKLVVWISKKILLDKTETWDLHSLFWCI